jgi:hypothetical protein
MMCFDLMQKYFSLLYNFFNADDPISHIFEPQRELILIDLSFISREKCASFLKKSFESSFFALEKLF